MEVGMSLSIRLLGRPTIAEATEHGERPRVLAGQKPWALLAYLLLSAKGATRRELAETLWPEAEDPLAAARWSILQVRRLALFLGLLAAVLVFDIAAAVWGADSRETLPDDHRR